jgi:hypothetical protein
MLVNDVVVVVEIRAGMIIINAPVQGKHSIKQNQSHFILFM